MTRRHPATLFFSLLLLLALGIACVRGDDGRSRRAQDADAENGPEADAENERAPIEVATLERGELEAVLTFSAYLEAEESVAVHSQAARLVTRLMVEEGDRVRRGDVLLRLEDDEQRSALARLEIQLEQAQREFARQKNLFGQQLISEKAFNDATYEVDQLELQVSDAKRELGYTTVRAPISGTVTQRLVNLGDNVTVGEHLFDLVDFDSLVARVFVPEKDLARLAVDQEARLRSTARAEATATGHILRIAPTVDPRTGTVKVTVDVPSEGGMVPGMYVEVGLVVDQLSESLLVPKRALLFDDTDVSLFRLRDDLTVERLRIRPAVEDRDHVVPAGDVLAAGDQVVIAGQAGLKDGAEVRLAGPGEEATATEQVL
ncbi:MAG: efflux RND transporter periplasmic adaptor subunit [Acidobacteriota bacterium]